MGLMKKELDNLLNKDYSKLPSTVMVPWNIKVKQGLKTELKIIALKSGHTLMEELELAIRAHIQTYIKRHGSK